MDIDISEALEETGNLCETAAAGIAKGGGSESVTDALLLPQWQSILAISSRAGISEKAIRFFLSDGGIENKVIRSD